MSDKKRYAVIMAGGTGERFWPLSTSKHPKQLLSIVGERSLVGMAVERMRDIIPADRIIVITSRSLQDAICAAVPETLRENVIGEPCGRDTAAACALASAIVKARDPMGCYCILPADHVIHDLDGFRATLDACFDLALSGDVLVTIGIKPGAPSTGFGYIEAGAPVRRRGRIKFSNAKRFVEKPDSATAQKYLDAGNFYWNSGMFIWSVGSIQRALAEHRKELFDMAERILPFVGRPEFNSRLEMEYGKIGKISVDYAIMEKARNIVMAKGNFDWDDVGSWNALENHAGRDVSGNVAVGHCETIDSEGNIVVSNQRLTALIGVRDMVVVQGENATLVCPKDMAQDVKKMVQMLRQKGMYGDVL